MRYQVRCDGGGHIYSHGLVLLVELLVGPLAMVTVTTSLKKIERS